MKFSKNVNNKKCAPKMIFFDKKIFEKDSDNFWNRKLTLNVRILPFLTTFAQLCARLKNFLGVWLLVLGMKEGLVQCATVCVKSVVILEVLISRRQIIFFFANPGRDGPIYIFNRVRVLHLDMVKEGTWLHSFEKW